MTEGEEGDVQDGQRSVVPPEFEAERNLADVLSDEEEVEVEKRQIELPKCDRPKDKEKVFGEKPDPSQLILGEEAAEIKGKKNNLIYFFLLQLNNIREM